MNRPLTRERLLELLAYDSATGDFHWKVSRGGKKAGSLAGTDFVGHTGRRYRRITIDGKQYLSHVLAILYVTGEWPQNEVDHKNGDGMDNRFINLRCATHSQNIANAKMRSDNSTGFKGVTKRGDKFRSAIRINQKRIHLGSFTTDVEAARAYADAASALFGEFARAA